MWDGLLGFAVVAGMLTMLPGLDTAQVLRSATLGGPRVAFAPLDQVQYHEAPDVDLLGMFLHIGYSVTNSSKLTSKYISYEY
jgi:hypothetical protein